METLVSSKTRTVHIGSDHPFVIIGERINPTGRKSLGVEMAAGNYERVEADAIAQVNAGAQMLDVNAGIPMADEPGILAEAIRRVQSVVDVPISVDSSIIAALEAGLGAVEGKPLVNSVTGEDERLEAVLPLVKKYGAAVIGISNDETGISQDPDIRFEVARKIVERAEDYGIRREDVLIDPLVMPVGAIGQSGQAVIRIIRRCRDELGVNTACGASNVSFGLPGRDKLNATFVTILIAAGMPCAITNPLETEIRTAVMAANALMGHDENCAAWIMENRSDEDAAAQRQRRRERRRDRSSD